MKEKPRSYRFYSLSSSKCERIVSVPYVVTASYEEAHAFFYHVYTIHGCPTGWTTGYMNSTCLIHATQHPTSWIELCKRA